MAALPTTTEAIERGYVSISLAGNYNAKSALFYGGKLNPNADITIMMVTYGLDWGNSGGAQTEQSLRSTANYLIWLCGMFGNQAAGLIAGGGGGSITPIGSNQFYPIYITEADFSTATLYPNTRIFGNNVIVYLNEINRYLIPGVEFTVGQAGITITLEGFDATSFSYNLVIEKYASS